MHFTEEDLTARAATRLGSGSTAQLAEAVSGAWAMAHGYTRGRGFGESEPAGIPMVAEDLAAVIVAAACRMAANPRQVESFTAGDYSERPARFLGFTLTEQQVLNRYRKRAL